jgi:hypothetical protein
MGWALGVVVLILLAFGGGGPKEGEGTNGDGTLPPGPPSNVPGRPKRGADGRGWAWRDDADVSKLPGPAQFDYGGNGLWIDPECGFVIEGDKFWPRVDQFHIVQISAPTLAATLALREDNTVLGFIDYLVDEEGVTDPIAIVWRVLDEAAPMCGQVDPSQWGEALRIWFNDFLERVTAYVTQGEIEFGGEG